MDELNYRCDKLKKLVVDPRDWEAAHSPHGAPTFEDHFRRYQWRVCPCGAKILEFKPGEITAIKGVLP